MFADSSIVFGRGEEPTSGEEREDTDMRVKIFKLAIICAIAMVMVLAGSPSSCAQQRRAIKLSGTEGLPFSDGVLVGNTLYVAGQEGTDDKGKLPAGGISPETQAALENIGRVIKQAGFELKDIVSVTVYLADIHDFQEMNKVYRGFMPDPKPARATVQAGGLVNNARIEISAIAVKQ
jgi:2-iminobutanoate/2-iminopropanoate deaminase